MLQGQRFGGIILPGGAEVVFSGFNFQKQRKHDIHLLKQSVQIVAAAIKTVTD